MAKEYCDVCNDFTSYKIDEVMQLRIVDNLIIKYKQKKNICLKCGNEFFTEDIINFNVDSYNKAYKKIFEPISSDEINQILIKYDIGKKPLARLLNWGEATIIRYLNGQVPNKAHSDVLKSILNSYIIMDIYLSRNKKNISSLAYKKVKNKIKGLELNYECSKLYIVSNYILKNSKDITGLALQKILYFLQGFSKHFIGEVIFDDMPEAWVNGPVYKDIYEAYNKFGYKTIDDAQNINFSKYLTDSEINYINYIIKYFGCYNGEVLAHMTHLTEPWKKNRDKKNINDSSNKVIKLDDLNKYFEGVVLKYNIKSLDDIYKYSNSLFNDILLGRYM